MEPKTYRRKPSIEELVKAMQWDGTLESLLDIMDAFNLAAIGDVRWLEDAQGCLYHAEVCLYDGAGKHNWIELNEGDVFTVDQFDRLHLWGGEAFGDRFAEVSDERDCRPSE